MGESREEIELEIKRTREALAEKVDALAEELGESVELVKEGTEQLKKGVQKARKAGVKVAVVAFVAVVGVLVVRRYLRGR
jgi:t-SNARE complex subunit (syntaxin)